MGLEAGQLTYPADGHRGGRGGVRHPRHSVVAVVQLSLQNQGKISI